MKKIVCILTVFCFFVGVCPGFALDPAYVGTVNFVGYHTTGIPIVNITTSTKDGAAFVYTGNFALQNINGVQNQSALVALALSIISAGKSVQFRTAATTNLSPVSAFYMMSQ